MIRKFTDHITLDTNKICFGVNETMKLLEEEAVETLIIHEELDYQTVELVPTDPKNGKEKIIKYLKLKDIQFKNKYFDKESKIEYAIVDYDSLVDYLGENYKKYKTKIFYISDLSPEGH